VSRLREGECLFYKGECIDTSYILRPEPNDVESELIRRCTVGIDLGADKLSILQLCYDEGQSPEHAELTYNAALLLIRGRGK
jgi:hypothetical protein